MIADRHVPIVAFALLLVGYVWVMLVIANLCIDAGLAGRAMPAGALTSPMPKRVRRWF